MLRTTMHEFHCRPLFTCCYFVLDCEQSLIFLCKVTAREWRIKPRAARNDGVSPGRKNKKNNVVVWIALDEIRTRRILREKADRKQSNFVLLGSIYFTGQVKSLYPGCWGSGVPPGEAWWPPWWLYAFHLVWGNCYYYNNELSFSSKYKSNSSSKPWWC